MLLKIGNINFSNIIINNSFEIFENELLNYNININFQLIGGNNILNSMNCFNYFNELNYYNINILINIILLLSNNITHEQTDDTQTEKKVKIYTNNEIKSMKQLLKWIIKQCNKRYEMLSNNNNNNNYPKLTEIQIKENKELTEFLNEINILNNF